MKIKKIIAVSVILAAAATAAFSAPKKRRGNWYDSYNRQLREGNILVNAGIGLNGDLGENYLDSYVPPLELTVEYLCPIENLPFGFGAFLGYSSFDTKYTHTGITEEIDSRVFYTGAMVNYHFNLVDELDLYGSVRTGIDFIKVTSKTTGFPDDTNSDIDFHYGMAAGATNYFSDTFGVNAEVGFPTILRVAASFKFRL